MDSKASDELFDIECGVCITKGKHREAESFCRECEGYLCSSCTNTHSRFPTLRNHKAIPTEDLKKLCGVCKVDGKKKEARYFCKECDSWICGNCKKSHENFKDLRKHIIIVPGKYNLDCDRIAANDVSDRFPQMSTLPVKKELFPKGGITPKPTGRSRNKQSYSSARQRDTVLTSSSQSKHYTDSPTANTSNINILCYKTIKKIKEIDVNVSGDRGYCWLTGCCFMPGNELVLCDRNNYKIKLLDRSLSLVDSLDLPRKPWDVAAVDNSNVIVTMPEEKRLQFIQVLPTCKLGRTIDVGEMCWGVAVEAGKIFISCYKYGDKVGGIRVYDLKGKDLRKRLGINPNGSNKPRWPHYVAVSRSGDKIFVSDMNTDTLSCLTGDGKMVYQYRDREMISPRRLLVDGNDNVIVCGYYNTTVQMITSAGQKHKTLLSVKDGIYCPQCVSFRPSDGTLLVGGFNDKLLMYQMS